MMNKFKNIQDVPDSLKEELNNHYEKVSWGKYGTSVEPETQSWRVDLNEIVNENVEQTTFDDKVLKGNITRSYTVRGIQDGNSLCVQSVSETLLFRPFSDQDDV